MAKLKSGDRCPEFKLKELSAHHFLLMKMEKSLKPGTK